ncbi:MAG: restriction endonuclease subunit S [Actinomycetota bacterium]|nr:restriction endonuclease subunit S [Actinomycetota bacterium]
MLEVTHGYAFASEGMSEERTGEPIIVSIGNFDYKGGFRFTTTRIRESIGYYPRQFILRPGDLLIAMTCQTPGGEILGIPGIIPDDGNSYLHNQRIGKVLVSQSRMDKLFAYYCFLSHNVNMQLVATASGTKILHTAPTRIGAVEIDLPPLPCQRAIAAALGALDDKIAVNDRIARASFDLASAHYEQLALTAESSLTLGEILDLKYGKALPAHQRVAGAAPVFGSGGVVGHHNEAIATGPGIIIGRKGTVGAVYWSDEDFFPIDTTFYVQLRKAETPIEFAYFAVRKLGLETMNTDSAVPGLNRGNALALRVPFPGASELQGFRTAVGPGFALRHALATESLALAQLRDTLLPKLMSGAIRVRDAEQIVGDAT